MLTIGLTGGIGSGKSTVARRLASLGAHVADADAFAHEVVAPGTRGLDAVVERFGRGVLTPDGSLDRTALGSIVFADPAARRDLEAITGQVVLTANQVSVHEALALAGGVPAVPGLGTLFATPHPPSTPVAPAARPR